MSGPAISTESYGDTAIADMALCKAVYEELTKHYPGHQWMVGANAQAGVVDIKLLYEHPVRQDNRFGFMLHMSSLNSNDGFKKVMHAGGELLERYGLPRRGYMPGDKMRAIENGLDRGGMR